MVKPKMDPAEAMIEAAADNARRIADAEAQCGGPVENILLDVETIREVEKAVAARKAGGDAGASSTLFIRNAVRAALAAENRIK